jgi:hypothetical protein
MSSLRPPGVEAERLDRMNRMEDQAKTSSCILGILSILFILSKYFVFGSLELKQKDWTG